MKRDSTKEKGDGLAFHNAVKLSRLKTPEVCKLLNISNGTLYNYYASEILMPETKATIAKVLGKSVDEVFTVIGNKSLNVEDLNSFNIKPNKKNTTKRVEKTDVDTLDLDNDQDASNPNASKSRSGSGGGKRTSNPNNLTNEEMVNELFDMQKRSTRAVEDIGAALKDIAASNLILAKLAEARIAPAQVFEQLARTGGGSK